MKKIWS